MTETPPVEEPRSMSIYRVMERILDEINATFIEEQIELPAKQFFDLGGRGETPHDCEQVSISFEQMYNGTPGTPEQLPTPCYGPRTGVFIVEIVRCTPTMKPAGRGGSLTPPTTAEFNASAMTQVKDAYILMDGALRAAESLDYVGGISDVSVSPESGGFQAVVLTLVVGIP